jgi:hypothetical protein
MSLGRTSKIRTFFGGAHEFELSKFDRIPQQTTLSGSDYLNVFSFLITFFIDSEIVNSNFNIWKKMYAGTSSGTS